MRTSVKFLRTVLLVGSSLAPWAVADACPVCQTENGRQVRAGIFNEDFGSNLLATLLPFPVVLGIAAALHFGFAPKQPAGQASASATSTEGTGQGEVTP